MNTKSTLTVFTPAYNRAHTISRTYESLCRQTCKDFEWLVIDDGSTDNTRQLIEGWMAENKIPIRYINQTNQGMHGAHNTAYKNITTELNTCIDSDDWMPDDAVELIVKTWKEKGSEHLAGIVGLDYDSTGKLIGTDFPMDIQQTTLSTFYGKGGKGDKKLVYRTDIVQKYPPYPIFEGEKYVGLSYLYLQIDQDYELLTLNKPLVIVEYQLDGSSFNMYRQYWKNPRGFMFYRRFEMKYPCSFIRRVKLSVHYISSCIRAKDYLSVLKNPQPMLTLLLLPLGIGFYFYTRNKVMSEKKMQFMKKSV